MNSEPDLHRALSLRPTVFHLRNESPAVSDRHRERDVLASPAGTSTAVEGVTQQDDTADNLTVRHPTAAKQDAFAADLELQSRSHEVDKDPYGLASRLKTPEEINSIQVKANTSRRRVSCGPIGAQKDAWKARKIRGFYEAQNENIERLLKSVEDHRREAKEEHGENHLRFKIAVHGSFAANVLLAGLQLYAAAASGSLSLFTTMADALFDPLSNLTLILSNRAVNRVDPRKFPSGKARIETAGNIFFCFLMCTVSCIIVVLACRDLAAGSSDETLRFHLPSVIAVAIAFTTKFSLFLYCWALRNKYSQIRILWEDHRNDLFINGFGLLTSIGGSKLKWWIDPMGAILLSVLIIVLWLRTAWSEFQLLIGVSADTQTLQLITYICEFSLQCYVSIPPTAY
jgi:divalent metal cation (Fe/Co/Zn/Cd) transporter